ncbi:MAG: AraC family transcriptional regulator [Acidobacteriota bacterium]|nr:AraC family transcriptional regulator [Acidobacteriota bacterium]
MTITGVQGTIVRSGREPGIVCHEVLYDSGRILDAHAHASAFIALTMNGRYRESACGLKFDCLPHSVVFHPAEAEHVNAVGDAPLRCFIVELDAIEMRRRYDAAAPATLLKVDGGPMAAVLMNLYGEFRHADACSSLAIQGLILQLLAGLSRTDCSDGERVREPWVGRVTEILRDRFRSHLTLEEIAAEVGASPLRVSAVFRRVYHRSIAEEQRRLRVEFASQRLRDRDASLADIALEAGFSDQPHFSRAFKQVTGMTPARFRDAESR